MSTPSQPQRSSSEGKKPTPPLSNIVTRNGARKAKIQTRAMASGAKPSSSLLAAKKNAQQKKKQTVYALLKDHFQIAMDCKNIVRGATGVLTHPLMLQHRCLWDQNYPECPERLSSILDRCKELGLLEECVEIEARPATREQVSALHSDLVFDLMKETHRNQDQSLLEDISSRFDAVFIHPTTHEAALLSAGSALQLVDNVWDGTWQNGFALIRPPGHHAMRSEPCGYCVYNNVGLAARRALEKGAQRILIVDWDVHHGQATQQMFHDDPRVVYFSVHRYEHGSFWPSLKHGDFPYVGEGAGRGFNFNVPLNRTGMGDGDYLAIWYQLLLPMAFEFRPDLILISAGYDAALGCPEGEMSVTPACYGWLTWLCMCVCSRVCVLLEGGYNVQSLSEGAAHTLRTLLGYSPPELPEYAPPCDTITSTILDCIYVHKPYWQCYQYQPSYSVTNTVPNVDDQNKVKHQVSSLWRGDETRPDRFETRNCYPVQDNETKRKNSERLDYLKLETKFPKKTTVGYLYDEVMLKHRNIFEEEYVECPGRVSRIVGQLRDYLVLSRLVPLPPRPATDLEILAVHTKEHLDKLKELSTLSRGQLARLTEKCDSVYFNNDSLESARMAAGCAIQAVKSVLSGEVSSAVCVIRPPGHHAGPACEQGFCLLNSAGIAAASLVPGRVLLLDWDVHHGNGTQEMFYNTDKVLYISIHRYDGGSFFPHSPAADHTRTGAGSGEGYNINIPWNKRGMGDVEYLSAMTQVVLPVASQFRPDLVLVSAGFDACVGDPLGGCNVSPECFAHMTSLLRTVSAGKVVLCLEGGYNLTATSHAATLCTKALLGDPIPYHYEPKATIKPSAIESINNVISVHKKYWSSLRFQIALPSERVLGDPEASRGLGENIEADRILALILEDTKKRTESSLLEVGLEKLHLNEEKPGCSSNFANQTLSSYLEENLDALVNEEMFAVVPLSWCPHLETLAPFPEEVQLRQGSKCLDCDETNENWVCLHCFTISCGRSISGHMLSHQSRSGHPLCLSLLDLSAWCSPCQQYVHHPALHPAKNNAHLNKFQEPMPWCYQNN